MNAKAEINIAIADDHSIFRDGLKVLLRKLKPLPLKIIGDVESGAAMIELANNQQPDLIFMDIQMPGLTGIETAKKIKSTHPKIKIIALSTFNDTSTITSMLEAGADGYLLKNATKSEIIQAIATVCSGHKFFSGNTPFQFTTEESAINQGLIKPRTAKLSKREQQILKCICEEKSIKEIAVTMRISVRTVETYRQRIMQKTGAKSLAGMVAFAIVKRVMLV